MNTDKRHEIRRALPSDAERLLTCLQSLDHESQFLLYEPEERDANINTQRTLLEQLSENPRNLLLVADTQDEIVGYLGARGHSKAQPTCASVPLVGRDASLSACWGRTFTPCEYNPLGACRRL